MNRRLPIYLVLDCSESMAGPAIEAVNDGVKALVTELRGSPAALESTYLSVITFSRRAEQVVPLTELLRFSPPHLAVRPGTSLGAALKLLGGCIAREVVRTSEGTKGDYKPLIFLMTDGQPTDEWEPFAEALVARGRLRPFYAVGCGPDVDWSVLRKLTDTVLSLPAMAPADIRKLFVWLSSSIYRSVAYGGDAGIQSDDASANLMAELPDGLTLVPLGASGPTGASRQVFLHARCGRSGDAYLMRFRWDEGYQAYAAVASHRLENFSADDASALPPIESSQLLGCPPCPHCGSPSAAVCPCGCLLCLRLGSTEAVRCPGCGAQLTDSGEAARCLVQRSQG